jgi:hypothetical protein
LFPITCTHAGGLSSGAPNPQDGLHN